MLDESIEHLAIDELDGKEAAVQHWSRAFRSRTGPLVNPPRSLRTSSLLMQKWEDELEGLAQQMLAARQYRNSHAFPCLLPAEVLEQVFKYLADIDPINTVMRKWGWATVTHVCRRFRTIALEHGELWSNLSVNGNALWDLFLPRSRNALLEIRGDIHAVGHAAASNYAALALQNIARVRVLDLVRVSRHNLSADSDWLRVLQAGKPNLQELRLALLPVTINLGPANIALGNDFFQTSPELTDLRLIGIQMPWNIVSLTKLRSLEIRMETLEETVAFSFADIVQSLRYMPMLELLRLVNALPFDGVFGSYARASLPNLRILLIEDCDSCCLSLWSCLTLPSTCSVYLEIESLEPQGDDLLRALVRDHLALVGRPPYRHICVGDENTVDDGIRFSAHSTPATIPLTSRKDGKHSYNLNQGPVLAIACQAFGRVETLPTFLALFPSESVETISLIDLTFAVKRRSLAHILRHFSHTSRLEINGSSDDPDETLPHTFCELFISPHVPQIAAPQPDAGQYFMPHLRTLRFDYVLFENRSRKNGRRLCHELTKAFRRRRAAGLQNPALELTKTRLKASWVQAWKEFVEVRLERECESLAPKDGSDGEGEDDENNDGEE